MKVTRLASLTALISLAGACHTAVPTEPAAEAAGNPAFDRGMYGSGNVGPDAEEGSGVGSDGIVANGDDFVFEASSGDSTPTVSPGGERGGNGFGSGN
jgi:hypothetical protein